MTTVGLEPLEPRDVVPADEADALIAELMREIDDLKEHERAVTAELGAAAERGTAPGSAELSQAAQLTVHFVEDLVATNRERMREVMAQRHVWVGERLESVEAEAHAIRGAALADLTAALQAHDPTSGALPDAGSIADMASVARPGPVDPAPPARVESVGPVHTAAAARPGDPSGADLQPPPVSVASVGLPSGREAATVLDPAGGNAASTIDAAVEAAVDAVLRELSDPQPSVPLAGPTGPETAVTAANLALIFDDHRDGVGNRVASGGDPIEQAHADFWREEVQASEPRRSRFAPRDLMVSMLVVALAVLALLVVKG